MTINSKSGQSGDPSQDLCGGNKNNGGTIMSKLKLITNLVNQMNKSLETMNKEIIIHNSKNEPESEYVYFSVFDNIHGTTMYFGDFWEIKSYVQELIEQKG